MKKFEKVFNTESEVADFGREIGRTCSQGDVYALIGDLGTGKTTLTKYIAEGLGVEESITSPTFNIVKSYYSGRIPIHHFDVYRLGSSDEFFDIGGDEYLEADGVCVIEWADLISDVLPESTKIIEISWLSDAKVDERIYRCSF